MSRSRWARRLGVGLWLATASLGQSEPLSAALAEGDRALQELDLPRALSAYQTAQAADPARYEANWKLARALCDTATLSPRADQKPLIIAAEERARAAVKLEPNDAAGHTALAIAVGKRALFEGGKRKVELSKEVREESLRALALNPRDDLAHHVLAVWHREMTQLNWLLRNFAEFFYGKFPAASLDQAVQHLRQAADLSPDNISHQTELGISYAAARNWPAAATALRRALSLSDSWVTDEHYRSLAREELKRLPQQK